MEYGKLVRDNIPAIIEDSGQQAVTRVLGHAEYDVALDDKLLEEVNEYLESGELEELADIQEVVLAIAKLKGLSAADLEVIRRQKADQRGGFEGRIFLDRTEP